MTGISQPQSDEGKMIVSAVDDIAAKYDHDYWRDCVDESRFPEELWNTLGEQGFLGINVPEKYGGEGMGMVEMAALVETLASHGVPSLYLVISATMAPIPIKQHGSEALKERFLPGLASGETKFAFAITEPDAGTNTYKIGTIADRDGDEYVLNGQKTFITGAKDADYIQLVARTTPYEEVKDGEKARGVSLFVVPTDTDGVDMDPLDLAIPETVKQYTVYFDDVRVPEKNVIGERGKGFYHVFDALNPERITTNALSVGLGRFALDRAVDYAKNRAVFDVPIGTHQGVQHPLSRATVDLELAAMANGRAARAFDEGGSNVGAYANMAKLAASESADRAVDVAIQTHGGNGFSREYDVITIERFTRLLRVAPVNNEMVLNHIAENLLGLPKSY